MSHRSWQRSGARCWTKRQRTCVVPFAMLNDPIACSMAPTGHWRRWKPIATSFAWRSLSYIMPRCSRRMRASSSGCNDRPGRVSPLLRRFRPRSRTSPAPYPFVRLHERPQQRGISAMMIQVDHVTKYFGPVLAVDDVSFEVDKGQVVGFLGLNGAGKTTTMRILTTYLPATSGVARVAGFDVMAQSMEVRQHIGYLPDNVPPYPEMRVEEYLDYRAKLKGVDRKKRAARLEECLDRCRIREVRRRLCGTLSKGYRQRVGLADSLIHHPAILILDEPTAGLDPEQQDQTLSLIRELGRERTILFSTHRLTEIEEICQQVIVIFRGRIRLHRKLKDMERDAPLVVEVRGPVEQVTNLLKSTDGVARVTSKPVEEGVTQYEIRAAGSKDLREAIGQRVINNGFGLRRLERRQNLHDYFLDLMRERDEPSRTAPPATALRPDTSPVAAS